MLRCPYLACAPGTHKHAEALPAVGALRQTEEGQGVFMHMALLWAQDLVQTLVCIVCRCGRGWCTFLDFQRVLW